MSRAWVFFLLAFSLLAWCGNGPSVQTLGSTCAAAAPAFFIRLLGTPRVYHELTLVLSAIVCAGWHM